MDLKIKFSSVVNTFSTAFKYINKDIEKQGREVAYLTYKIGQYLGYNEIKLKNMMIAAYVHDMGACKIDINKNVWEFDSNEIKEHVIHSYLFVKYFSPIPEYAPIILYHHHLGKEYKEIGKIEMPEEANILQLVDAIVLFKMKREENKVTKEELVDYVYSLRLAIKSKYIEALLEANRKEKSIDKLLNGSYSEELRLFLLKLDHIPINIQKYMEFLGFSVEVKSQKTVLHSLGVLSCTRNLCALLDMEEENSTICCFAAFLHDIGKVAIPTHILKKNDKLTEEEYEIMKKHVIYTREIISNLDHAWICNIASNHHEKLNGKGYPNHLKNMELEERIVAVADIFSALTEKRYYREGFCKEKVIDMLKGCSEKNELDKSLVEIVICYYDDIVNDIEKINNIYGQKLNKVNQEYYYLLSEME